MNSLKVSCNNCGNVLEITNTSKYVTCNSCNSLLELVNTGTSYYTVEKVDTTPLPSMNLQGQTKGESNSQIYTEIEMLDREWNNNLPNFMVKGTLPDAHGILGAFTGVIIMIVGIIWIIAVSSHSPPLMFFGIVFIIAGMWSLVNDNNRRTKFLNEKNRCEQRRNELQLKLKHQ